MDILQGKYRIKGVGKSGLIYDGTRHINLKTITEEQAEAYIKIGLPFLVKTKADKATEAKS